MFDITIITGLASVFGCLCMALVCAAQIGELFAAARSSTSIEQPWDMNIAWPARGSWTASAWLDGQLAPSAP